MGRGHRTGITVGIQSDKGIIGLELTVGLQEHRGRAESNAELQHTHEELEGDHKVILHLQHLS